MKKLTSLIILTVIILSGCSFQQTNFQSEDSATMSVNATSSSLPAVEFLYAKTPNSNLVVYVELENIAYSKTVTLFYSIGNGEWLTADGTFQTTLDNNRELWKIETPQFISSYKDIAHFAVRYQVAGVTYWDNNNGNDYHFGIHSSYFGGNNWSYLGKLNVRLHRLWERKGYILVKNLAFEKEVKLIWSQDKWATVNETIASYHSDQLTGQEYWVYEDERIINSEPIEAAVVYTVNGVTYWDNNFGNNYTWDNQP